MKILTSLMFAVSVLAQSVAPTSPNVHQLFYSGSNLQYDCQAPAMVSATIVQVSDTTLTSIVVATNVGTVTTSSAHGLWVGAVVMVSGSTTVALNGTYRVASTPSTTTYTLTTSGVVDGTYNNGVLVITTNAPLLTSTVWSVSVLHYTSNVLDGVYLGNPGASVAFKAQCSLRANY